MKLAGGLQFGLLVALVFAAHGRLSGQEIEPPPEPPARPNVEVKESPADAPSADVAATKGVRRALIVVGLPGDEEHRQQFAEITTAWLKWLKQLGYADENVFVLAGSRKQAEPPAKEAATQQALKKVVADLKSNSQPDDSLWVFFLGHGDYDDEHAHFHLPGPDFHEKDLAELFTGVKCREQVFWLTHSCSGWFLKALARKQRVVVVATAADSEFNDTEFPRALVDVMQQPSSKWDLNSDGRVSVAELFKQAVNAVKARYEADMRAPTEHAQLDDNGDGRGTEAADLNEPVEEQPTEDDPALQAGASIKSADGLRAAQVYLPKIQPAEPDNEKAEPETEKAELDNKQAEKGDE